MAESIRVATVCQNGAFHGTVEENRAHVVALLKHVASVGPDLVVLPEAFTTVGIEGGKASGAEPVPGPTTDACGRAAREHRTHVVCPIRTVRDEVQYNSAVIIDRSGGVVGIYDKAQPVTSSPEYTVMEDGVRPGRVPPPVFDLDFGRIGVQICYDAGFPETWHSLAEQGARLVAWPSAYNGGFALRAYAYLHHYFVVSSVRTDGSRIIDPLGTVRARTDQRLTTVWADIGLDYAVCHWDFNYSIPERLVAEYGDRVAVTSNRDSAHFLLETRSEGLSIADLSRQFGFEDTATYHERHRRAYAALREGRAAEPQQPLHAERSQYTK